MRAITSIEQTCLDKGLSFLKAVPGLHYAVVIDGEAYATNAPKPLEQPARAKRKLLNNWAASTGYIHLLTKLQAGETLTFDRLDERFDFSTSEKWNSFQASFNNAVKRMYAVDTYVYEAGGGKVTVLRVAV